jgi:peptidoglycan/xylan/chitin deacetylase (PgdA/CDA1 family)
MAEAPISGQIRPRLRLPVAAIAVITASLCGSLLHAAPARAATAPTVVTIGFDDGTAEQVDALPILQAHGMKATFFVNTGVIGDAEHLSWADLHTCSTPATRSPATPWITRTWPR